MNRLFFFCHKLLLFYLLNYIIKIKILKVNEKKRKIMHFYTTKEDKK